MTDSILILEARSERNAGDAVMQLALRDVLQELHPNKKLIFVTRFGFNQTSEAIQEMPELAASSNVSVLPGSYPTFVHFRADESRLSAARRRIGKMAAAAWMTPLLVCHALDWRIPARAIARIQGRRINKIAESSLMVICIGRNIRRVDGVGGYFKMVELLANPALLASATKPKFVYGASFWPVRNKVARAFLRGIFRSYDKVYVRETGSLRNAKNLGLSNVELMPDLSFYYLDRSVRKLGDGGELECRPIRTKTFAVTLVAPRELSGVISLHQYVTCVASAIRLIQKRYGFQPVVTRQVTYGPELEDETIELVRQEVPELQVLPAPRKIEDLLAVYGSAQFLLATRMHSAIFALATGTPIVALPYDWRGKWQILVDLGVSESYLLPLERLDETKLLSAIEQAIGDWDTASVAAEKIAQGAVHFRAQVELDIHGASQNKLEREEGKTKC